MLVAYLTLGAGVVSAGFWLVIGAVLIGAAIGAALGGVLTPRGGDARR